MTGPFFPSVDPATLRLRDQHLPQRLQAADLVEAIQDIIGSMASGTSPVAVAYNDTLGTLAVSLDAAALAEVVQDVVGAMLVGGTYNDAAGTYTLPVAPFSPGTLSGLALWLDSADPGTLFTDTAGTTPAVAEAAAVAYWADKSGNSRHATQSTVGNRPALNRYARNGRNVLYFDGTNDTFSTTLNPSTTLTEGLTTFVVAKLDDTASRTYSWLYGDSLSGTSAGLFLGKLTGVDQLHFAAAGWHSGINAGAGGFVGGYHVFGQQESDTVRRALLDGAPLTDATSSDSAMTITAFNVGGRPASAEYWKGPIAELIVYNRVLTTSERQVVEAYLRGKWATP